MKYLGYLGRILAFPFFAGITLVGVTILWLKYLVNFARFGGEAVSYTHKNMRTTIKDIYNILEKQLKEHEGKL